jgi:hypothetical protein
MGPEKPRTYHFPPESQRVTLTLPSRKLAAAGAVATLGARKCPTRRSSRPRRLYAG